VQTSKLNLKSNKKMMHKSYVFFHSKNFRMNLQMCPFNSRHQVLAHQIRAHTEICPDRVRLGNEHILMSKSSFALNFLLKKRILN